MNPPDSASSPDAEQPTFEAALAELESILHDLEEGQIGLEASLSRYEQGTRLLKHCYALLENAERRIELCTGIDAEGNPLTTPFDEYTAAAPEMAKETAASPRRASRRSSVPPSSAKRPRPDLIDEPDLSDEDRGLF